MRDLTINTQPQTDTSHLPPRVEVDFAKVRLNAKTVEDAALIQGDLSKSSQSFTKDKVRDAIIRGQKDTMIEMSQYFSRLSGIYKRLCRHMSNFYRYDWVVTPHIKSDKIDNKKIVTMTNEAIRYLDRFQVKKFLGEAALTTIINGCYYCYILRADNTAYIQELPPKYCRVRMTMRNRPVVEMNMKYFNDEFRDPAYRARVLQMFPQDFQRGYRLYLNNQLPPMFQGDSQGWYVLDPENAFKFSVTNDDFPMFISTVPYILDLDAAQELDRRKMAQNLLKIIVQKLPLTKDNDLVFDTDEMGELHNNIVTMLAKAIGVDVITTVGEIQVEDMADTGSVTSIDQLEKVERTVYNESGTAQNLFNTDGNIALEKSILDDEANMYSLILQFEDFLNVLLAPFNKKNKKIEFTASILPTTIYNYKEMSKLYKEQTQLGYSKMLPQVALGMSQSTILATAKYENEILKLSEILIPPMSSNTMSGKAPTATTEENKGGREEKPDDEKSEKTIANRESMG